MGTVRRRLPTRKSWSARSRSGTAPALRLRPIRPDDADRLVALYGRLSQQTAYQRFFTVLKRLPPDWAQVFATVDFRHRLAIVAERETSRRPRAHRRGPLRARRR